MTVRLGETFQATDSNTSIFLVGRNSRGQWIARDQDGLRGGLFVSRAAAFKFARFETGNRPELVVAVPGILELDLAGPAAPEPDYRLAA